MRVQPLRAAAVLGTVVSLPAGGIAAGLARPAHRAWRSLDDPSVAAADRVAAGVLVASACLLVLAGCWLAACVAAELLEQCRPARVGTPWATGRLRRPEAVRTCVALLLGTALTGPWAAVAGDRPDLPAEPLAGLPLPDRLTGRAVVPAARPTPLVVRVRAGDCLWRLAAGRLPPSSSPGVIDAAWRRLYASNRQRVGPDPDLLLPGTVLRVPRHL